MPDIGPVELIIILVIVCMLFGVGKLPEVFGSVGRGVREFRQAMSEKDETPAPPASQPVASQPAATEPASQPESQPASLPASVEIAELGSEVKASDPTDSPVEATIS